MSYKFNLERQYVKKKEFPNIGTSQYIRQMLTAIKGKLTVTQ